MLPWQIALAIALPIAALALIFFSICLFRNSLLSKPAQICKQSAMISETPPRSKKITTYSGLLRLRMQINSRDPLEACIRHTSRASTAWRAAYPIKVFNWSEHPALVAEAVEHGWATFAFIYTYLASPLAPRIWNLCTGCLQRQHLEPEIGWEVGEGNDYTQRMRLNPGLLSGKDHDNAIVQALQTTLPLPGPPLGPLSFPEDGYFEITIIADNHECCSAELSQCSFSENEHSMLITSHLSTGKNLSSELSFNNAKDSYGKKANMESNGNEKDEKSSEDATIVQLSEAGKKKLESNGVEIESELLQMQQICAVGLSAGGAPPFRLPGCDPGSVGFLSSGRVFLNGAEQATGKSGRGTEKKMWGEVNTTVGCGFNPRQKKVFFTVNGELVHELFACKNRTTTTTITIRDHKENIDNDDDEFWHPLFPTIAANYDVTMSANFGQNPFVYADANAHRVSDPCFHRRNFLSTHANSTNGTATTTATLNTSKHGYGFLEDSADLFSMGRINSQWLSDLPLPLIPLANSGILAPPSPPPNKPIQLLPSAANSFWPDAESDLFEIVLDLHGRGC